MKGREQTIGVAIAIAVVGWANAHASPGVDGQSVAEMQRMDKCLRQVAATETNGNPEDPKPTCVRPTLNGRMFAETLLDYRLEQKTKRSWAEFWALITGKHREYRKEHSIPITLDGYARWRYLEYDGDLGERLNELHIFTKQSHCEATGPARNGRTPVACWTRGEHIGESLRRSCYLERIGDDPAQPPNWCHEPGAGVPKR